MSRMGYATRYLLAVTLFMLLTSTALPAMLGGPEGVHPPEVTLPGKDGTATLELDVVKDSVIRSAGLDVAGGPVLEGEVIKAGPGTTVAFYGEVDFWDPLADLSWYLGELVDDRALPRASDVDGLYVRNNSTVYACQVYLVDIEPRDLHSLEVSWTGRANATIGPDLHTGARLYVYDNATVEWELVDGFDEESDTDHQLAGAVASRPTHYVNRTFTGQDKVILLVVTNWGGWSTLSTDAISVNATYATYPMPLLDVGGDGTVEWGFGFNRSTGSLGYVDAFTDERDQASVSFPAEGGSVTDDGFWVPKGVEVTSALLDYRAFPTTGERAGGGSGVTVERGRESAEMWVGNVPQHAHQSQSSLLLTDGLKHNITDQLNEDADGILSLGVGTVPSQTAMGQVFQSGVDGYLSGLDIFVEALQGDPGNLTVHIHEANPSDLQTVLRTITVTVAEANLDAWNHIAFEPIKVQAGDFYGYSLFAFDAGAAYSGWMFSYNTSDPYKWGGCHVTQSGNATGPWSTISLYDMCFRTYVNAPIEPEDATNLTLYGNPGRLVTSGVVFDVSYFEYIDGNWTFRVANMNNFTVSFNWSAWTRFRIFAEHPELDVGDDGSVDWKGIDIWATAPIDMTASVQRVLDDPEWPLTMTDEFGNVFYRVPLNLSATSEGDVALTNLAVHYTGSLSTGDLTDSIDKERAGRQAGPGGLVRVPVNITSETTGTINVTAFNIEYDLPPHSLPIGDITFDEDTNRTIDLDTIIFDDYDNNDLDYTVVRDSGDEDLAFELTGRSMLLFGGPVNWSGSASFHITAVDGSNLSYTTNTFNVTVRAVNDPPLLLGLGDQEVYFDVQKAVPVDLVDNDSPVEGITVTTSSPRVWYDAGNGTMVFMYPNGSLAETVEVNVSDGQDSSVYSVRVDPRESNEPPVLALPASFLVTLDAQGTLDLAPYATDLESSQGELVWSVVSSPVELVVSIADGHILQVIPVAAVEGNHTVVLRVTDPDENSVQGDLLVRIRGSARNPPVILRGEDALPARVKVERDGSVVLNLALQKYWFDQEDYNRPQVMRWEVVSLRPNLFTVEIDADHRLTIRSFDRTGAGYVTFRLIDSDGDVSTTESMQVEVVEPASATSSWLLYGLAVLVIFVVVGLLMVASRRRGTARPTPPKPPAAVAPVKAREVAPRAPAVKAPEETPPVEPPMEEVPGRIVQVLVIHESTSLMAQMSGGPEHQLPEEKEDDLIEQSTLFAEERFEGAKVGTIKGFKFDGGEVLVGKGINYFLVARCSGTEFDDVATEMKRSIINIDVAIGETIAKWFPGQQVSPLEDELRSLLGAGQ